MSLQEQNSPLKTLLEIIVKHHITKVKDDSANSNKSDCVQSDPTRLFDSPAVTSAVVNGTKIQGLRYGTCSSFDLAFRITNVFIVIVFLQRN